MSAFLLWLRRDRAPVSPDAFLKLFSALRHRGPDGRRAVWRSGAILGHQHFWTVPEEVGERQPHTDPELGFDLVWDGRLDNRAELLRALDSSEPEAARLSDVAIVARAYRRWGDSCLERLLGPFAMLVLDSRRRRVLCGRDALGDRPLFFSLTPRDFLVASEEQALLAHPGVSSALDEVAITHFFAVEPPPDGTTFFSDVRALPPGCGLAFEGDHLRQWRTWQPAASDGLEYRRDTEYVEHFRELLDRSVRCRLRSTGRPMVLMSGGLDSTSVAALAARRSSSCGRDALATISWIFEELEEADEREFIDSVNQHLALSSIPIRGDDAWPLSQWPRGLVDPNTPVNGAFRCLLERSYAAVREAGGRTLLTGEFGDRLYYGHTHWLRDFLSQGRIGSAFAGVIHELCRAPVGGIRRLRSALGRVLGRPAWKPGEPDWLTPWALRSLAGPARQQRREARRPEQLRMLVNALDAQAVSSEASLSVREGVDLRRPYRDRRLVEYALALPAHQLYRRGWSKWILREAMAGILPERVRLRKRPSSLMPLAVRGLAERELETATALLTSPDAEWPRYVRPAWLSEAFPGNLHRRIDGISSVIPWRCICWEIWRRRRLEASSLQKHTSLCESDLTLRGRQSA